ncbi:hypothetical protein HYC85_020631 [Camellia sinensis]|uniref:Uncharacterized protein n=1 Tax=Camellia sinensis TaxID=4442 RepID=A0A7J7GQB2_CAMSI|nr:hypothetical protein HYC85_020631 [Camellia sinensis]
MENRSMTGVFVVQDNKSISKSNASVRLLGSCGEIDGPTMECVMEDLQYLSRLATMSYSIPSRRVRDANHIICLKHSTCANLR